METLTAFKVVEIMKKRDCIIAMRQSIQTQDRSRWELMVKDARHPIPGEVKQMFAEAVNKALDYFDSQIEQL